VTQLGPSPSSDASAAGVTLRLLWPQWQGAGTSSVRALALEFPFEVARRGYAVGTAVLAAVLTANQGPTAAAPVAIDDTGLELAEASAAVSIAPFSALARRYGDDLAIIWIDSHPAAAGLADRD
jgi:arginase